MEAIEAAWRASGLTWESLKELRGPQSQLGGPQMKLGQPDGWRQVGLYIDEAGWASKPVARAFEPAEGASRLEFQF